MTELIADLGKCQGYANCVVSAPDIFDLDDNGKVVLLATDVGPARENEALDAVRSCPATALTMKRNNND
ncbi:ferredoxin [Rhodococcus artemisiae]|uniref:Ferredoxin n=1 Tax=Rhodococcus artemisiae TaxID=714159 RepID=A0ABU7LGS3_9NOCA|nr:ferredoxin [Rhodococcus artemisiae]MEE2060759.1 ferredoxin [Rhodococcus artemisiae]